MTRSEVDEIVARCRALIEANESRPANETSATAAEMNAYATLRAYIAQWEQERFNVRVVA